VAARALDVVQPDMRSFGFTLQLEMDKMLRGSGIRLAPHNWGSLVGFYMQVQLARGIETFFRAERDPLYTDVLVADGYEIKDGHARVPTAPGFGLALAPGALGTKLKPAWEVKA
jgi:L-alanine-DL-glutamate epimerase-like enolase superfamily enzyme